MYCQPVQTTSYHEPDRRWSKNLKRSSYRNNSPLVNRGRIFFSQQNKKWDSVSNICCNKASCHNLKSLQTKGTNVCLQNAKNIVHSTKNTVEPFWAKPHQESSVGSWVWRTPSTWQFSRTNCETFFEVTSSFPFHNTRPMNRTSLVWAQKTIRRRATAGDWRNISELTPGKQMQHIAKSVLCSPNCSWNFWRAHNCLEQSIQGKLDSDCQANKQQECKLTILHSRISDMPLPSKNEFTSEKGQQCRTFRTLFRVLDMFARETCWPQSVVRPTHPKPGNWYVCARWTGTVAFFSKRTKVKHRVLHSTTESDSIRISKRCQEWSRMQTTKWRRIYNSKRQKARKANPRQCAQVLWTWERRVCRWSQKRCPPPDSPRHCCRWRRWSRACCWGPASDPPVPSPTRPARCRGSPSLCRADTRQRGASKWCNKWKQSC